MRGPRSTIHQCPGVGEPLISQDGSQQAKTRRHPANNILAAHARLFQQELHALQPLRVSDIRDGVDLTLMGDSKGQEIDGVAALVQNVVRHVQVAIETVGVVLIDAILINPDVPSSRGFSRTGWLCAGPHLGTAPSVLSPVTNTLKRVIALNLFHTPQSQNEAAVIAIWFFFWFQTSRKRSGRLSLVAMGP